MENMVNRENIENTTNIETLRTLDTLKTLAHTKPWHMDNRETLKIGNRDNIEHNIF